MVQNSVRTVCLVAAVFLGGTALASAQGGSTDPRGNAIGSEHVGSGGGTTNGGAMRKETHGTTGMSGNRSARDNPNGSPNAAPKAKQGPQGDPSKDEDAPK